MIRERLRYPELRPGDQPIILLSAPVQAGLVALRSFSPRNPLAGFQALTDEKESQKRCSVLRALETQSGFLTSHSYH